MSELARAGRALNLWFYENMRPLPWRQTRDPYCIWVSEVMLQQTRVETVLRYYDRFLAHFPTVQSLASADKDEVFKLWEGLGYYRRAEYLIRGARYIVDTLDGEFPKTAENLRKIPGIGDYTAAAVAAQAFGEKAAAVDGNVLRVTARLTGFEDPIDKPAAKEKAAAASLAMMPQGEAWSHTQAMMELGALICLPKSPRCNLCPVQPFCRAFLLGLEQELPVRPAKKGQTVIRRAVYLITDGTRWLIRRRPEEGLLRGMWEFPGEDAGEEGFLSAFAITCREPAMDYRHVFTHRIWDMQAQLLTVAPCEPPERCRWVTAQELEALALPSAVSPFRTWILQK